MKASTVLLYVLAGRTVAQCNPSFSRDITLRGTTASDRPELAGVVEADEIRPFAITWFEGRTRTVFGTIQDTVIRRDRTGTLDFEYRIVVDPASDGPISSVVKEPFSSTADVDYRIDGLGTVAPDIALINRGCRTIGTNYSIGIGPGQSSRFVFLGDRAVAFGLGGSTRLFTPGGQFASTVVETFQPNSTCCGCDDRCLPRKEL
jgi:hypothetical protein